MVPMFSSWMRLLGSFVAFCLVAGGGDADVRPDGGRLAGIMLRGDWGLFFRLPSGVELLAVVGGSVKGQSSVTFSTAVSWVAQLMVFVLQSWMRVCGQGTTCKHHGTRAARELSCSH